MKVLITGGAKNISAGIYNLGKVANIYNPAAIAEIYNPETRIFSKTGNMFYVRYWHAITLIKDGKVL